MTDQQVRKMKKAKDLIEEARELILQVRDERMEAAFWAPKWSRTYEGAEEENRNISAAAGYLEGVGKYIARHIG